MKGQKKEILTRQESRHPDSYRDRPNVLYFLATAHPPTSGQFPTHIVRNTKTAQANTQTKSCQINAILLCTQYEKINTMLYLIRHCSTSENDSGILCSDKDFNLSENGNTQGQKLSEWFADKKIDLILTSDLERAKQTAEFISYSTNAEIKVFADLGERNVDEKYANLGLNELKEIRFEENKKIIDPTQDWFGVPKVESDNSVFLRIWNILQKYIESDKNIACITHAGVIKSFLHSVFLIDESRSNAFKVRNACVLVFQNEKDFDKIQLSGMYQFK